MSQSLPHLKIKSPQTGEQVLELDKSDYTIGRVPEFNDIGLPEEDGFITRKNHCILTRNDQQWWLIDRSMNGTILERKGEQIQLQDVEHNQIQLFSGDRILIHYWELVFIDPNQKNSLDETTQDLQRFSIKSNYKTAFVFNITQLTFHYIKNGEKVVVEGLRPTAIDMLVFMARKNLDNNNQPIVCEYDELIDYIWRNDNNAKYDKDPQNIHTLANEIRNCLRKFLDNPDDYLETKRSRGYMLKIDCEL